MKISFQSTDVVNKYQTSIPQRKWETCNSFFVCNWNVWSVLYITCENYNSSELMGKKKIVWFIVCFETFISYTHSEPKVDHFESFASPAYDNVRRHFMCQNV